MTHQFTYQATLAASEKIRWRVEDVIGNGKELNFSKPFMPESLARVESLGFLTPSERIVLNQIRGNAYLCIFGLVEEFILPFVLDHARPQLPQDDYRTRALLQFAGEEAKHIHLFKCFQKEFERGFGTECQVIGPASEVGKAVLAHDPFGIALAILQIEWMTQRHYLDSIQDDQQLDPLFKSLLRHHWMEEAQHAKLDTLMVEALASTRTQNEISRGIEEYLEIGMFMDAGLKQQTEFDLQSLETAIGRQLTEEQRAEFRAVQVQANRWTYLGSGITHPNFLETVEKIQPEARIRLQEVAPMFF